MASDQHVHGQQPSAHPPRQASMIGNRGLPTRLPGAYPRAELAGAARSLRRDQGCGDPGAASRGHRAAPKQPSSIDVVARPRRAQCAEQAAPHLAAPAAARVAQNPAALARPPRCPPLDLPAPTPRPTTHRTNVTDLRSTGPNRDEPGRKSGAAVDNISSPLDAVLQICSRYDTDPVNSRSLRRSTTSSQHRALSCGNSLRATVIARVELRGFEPLTL